MISLCFNDSENLFPDLFIDFDRGQDTGLGLSKRSQHVGALVVFGIQLFVDFVQRICRSTKYVDRSISSALQFADFSINCQGFEQLQGLVLSWRPSVVQALP